MNFRSINIPRIIIATTGLSLVFYYSFTLILMLSLPFTYIKSIKTTTYDSNIIKDLLVEFNFLAGEQIFSFTSNRRYITIEENDVEVTRFSRDTIGLSYTNPAYCKVYIHSDLGYDELTFVVWHELLHCYGFGHVEEDHGLMNPFYSGLDMRNSSEWASKVRERVHYWKL